MSELALIISRLSVVESRVHDVQVTLPPMAQALAFVSSKVQSLDGQVQVLLTRQDETQQLLGSLYQEFKLYVDDYLRRTELQLSETRIVKVRQELEQRFGHYDEVRRRVTGILQATDVSIVRQETIRTASEELMLAAPRYWLTPALVALMAWIVDERDIADRALVEALKRDEYKTGLFLTLVCRRAGRWESMNRWLGLYLQLLDPFAIDREVVVVLDAVATGTLGRNAQELFWQTSLGWIEALRQVPGQVEEQARRWLEVLDAERGVVGSEECKVLRTHTPVWPSLEASLANVRRNHRVLERFRQILQSPTLLPASVTAAVDELLDTLVSRFDEEELPLRRQERLLQLIIDGEGDRKQAEQRMAVEEQALAEKVSFVARLTNALMHPDQSGATRAAQRFAAAFSRDWILTAHLFLVQRDQKNVSPEVEIVVGDWRGASRDGNGQELSDNLRQHYEQRTQLALAAVKLPAYAWLSPSISLVFVLGCFRGVVSVGVAVAMLVLGGLIFALGKRSQNKARETLATTLARQQGEALATLDACLKEMEGYRRSWGSAHAEACEVEELLKSIKIADGVYPGSEEEATALLPGGNGGNGTAGRETAGGFRGSQLAEKLAAWNLIPPPSIVYETGAAPN